MVGNFVGGAAVPATGSTTELLIVLGLCLLIGIVLVYTQRPAVPVVVTERKKAVVSKRVQEDVKRPVDWSLGGTAPGWTSGRWLGGGDFRHFNDTTHPFHERPHFAGHPSTR